MDVKDSCYRTKTPFLALLACLLAVEVRVVACALRALRINANTEVSIAVTEVFAWLDVQSSETSNHPSQIHLAGSSLSWFFLCCCCCRMGGLTLDLRPGAGLGAFNLGMCLFSLTISLEPCEAIEKRKTKTNNERKDTVGSIRVSYRRFGELGILMMYYSFGFYFRVCTDTKLPFIVHNSLLLLSIPQFWSEFVVLYPQFLVC